MTDGAKPFRLAEARVVGEKRPEGSSNPAGSGRGAVGGWSPPAGAGTQKRRGTAWGLIAPGVRTGERSPSRPADPGLKPWATFFYSINGSAGRSVVRGWESRRGERPDGAKPFRLAEVGRPSPSFLRRVCQPSKEMGDAGPGGGWFGGEDREAEFTSASRGGFGGRGRGGRGGGRPSPRNSVAAAAMAEPGDAGPGGGGSEVKTARRNSLPPRAGGSGGEAAEAGRGAAVPPQLSGCRRDGRTGGCRAGRGVVRR